jgi:hypothetical protein
MARRSTLTLSLVAVSVLVTGMAAPAVFEAVQPVPAPHPPQATSVAPGLAMMSLDGGVRPAALPVLGPETPQGRAFGLWVSASATLPPLVGPAPVAEAHTTRGRAEERAHAVDLYVRSPDGSSELAFVKGIKAEAAARTLEGPDNRSVVHHWSTIGRSNSIVTYARLLDGKVEATLLEAHAFALANQRTGDLRFDSTHGKVAVLKVFGQEVKVSTASGSFHYPIATLGNLYINQTIVNPDSGMVENYALRLQLNNGIDIIVSGAQARTAVITAGQHVPCITWSEAYPVGAKTRDSSNRGDVRHNTAMGDVVGAGEAYGRLDDEPVEVSPFVAAFDSALAEHHTIVEQGLAWSQGTGEARSVNLLNGLVKANLVRGVASVRIAGNLSDPVVDTVADQAVILGLKVQNTIVEDTTQVNTVIPVRIGNSEVATLIINEQTILEDALDGVYLGAVRLNMLRLVVTAHGLGVPIGTQIVVGHTIVSATCGDGKLPPMPPMDWGNPLGYPVA